MNTTKTLVTSVKMTLKKSTAGTHVFEDKAEGAPIPTLYIKKAAFEGGQAPDSITVTVEAEG